MGLKDNENKVISLSKRIGESSGMKKSTHSDKKCKKETRVIAITSGKGGVGKTNIVANLGLALSKLGKKVIILDADLGLGNLDVLLGLAPKYNLSHVISGEKSMREIILKGPGDVEILPASSGIQELTQLSEQQKIQILTKLDLLIDSVDVLLIDTAAGISTNVLDFNATAQEILIVVSPEPTSLTDAYALMKVLSLKYAEKHCKLVVNQAASDQEGREIYRQLNIVAERFLDISVEYFGCILMDEKVTKSIRRQKIVLELYPDSPASRCFGMLAKKVKNMKSLKSTKGDSNLFWKHLAS
ncbi:MAG: MinD/ParA family protein [Thermodesulfobacteriota bacterium]|nr:MinD/ParA family protein [Thermodesulfobacteriota bacterium]